MQDLLIPKMTVIGTGLIGGSLALALKAAGAVGVVTGVGRGLANLQQAVELGVIDRFSQDAEAAVADADVVFLSTPVKTLPVMAARVLPHMKPGAILTDGGSVKEHIVAEIEPLVPAGVHFVPGHPIAGTERSGAVAAFASLYQDRRCILTPTERTDTKALELVRRMWQAAGSEVVTMDVTKHDRILAAISHLPHMVAYALVNAVASDDRYGEDILKYSAGGFRDFTRIASSDPSMWRDIALTNREALLDMIGGFESMLAELKQDIADGQDDSLFNFFLRSKERRDALL
ncbi:prephenate dehydrogenase [Syntrophotalea acetylenivorans]|uniref:prephenate dehydrogenase n=1 Tax=Syntrophotalea acetylenivorans TaxID=1842532 RepID=A0A1L3GN75_9BACT|nr:prephenate dehydrogenase/arogenate dehydrogenase family protein [Syntrophotalea acetylenivorans]APG27118.1 prephenate dehydrogenase [Syntrophotalea acetylenivorans]